MFLQVHSRALNAVLSFQTNTPFDRLPTWRALKKMASLEEKEAALRNPDYRRKLVEEAHTQEDDGNRGVGPEARAANFEWLFLMDQPTRPTAPSRKLPQSGTRTRSRPSLILALEKNLKQFFLQPLANENQEHVLEMMKHPRSVITFSDSGAHVSQIMDSSLQTHVLSHWVREKQEITLEAAVRQLTFVPASQWGLHGRGLLREGMTADVVVFDPETVGPMMPELTYDLPAGARRLKQKAAGFWLRSSMAKWSCVKTSIPARCLDSCCAVRWRSGKRKFF